MAKAFTLLAIILLYAFSVYGQTDKSGEQAIPVPTYVGKINFKGNRTISEEELRLIIGSSESRSFLGLGLFGSAQKPFNPEEFDKDVSLIKKLYTYKGYFFAEVNAVTVPRKNGRKVNLNILIRENEPSTIDAIHYEGLEHVPAELKTEYLRKNHLKVNDVFSVERLIEERDRTISFFKEYGFAFFHEDSVRIKIDTVGTHAGILFRLSLPERLKYAPIHAVVHNPLGKDAPQQEKNFPQEKVNIKIIGRQKLSPTLIASSLEFQPGNYTSQSLEQRTLENLGATNVFSSIYITPDSVRAGKLYTTVNLEPAPKHQIEPKILVDNRYGPLFFGTSLAYENKNMFGGGEQFRTSTEYGTQASSNNKLLSSLDANQYATVIPYEFSLKSTLLMPVLKKPGNFYSATVEYATTKQPVLLSSRSGLIRTTYNARLNPSSRLSFDFFEVEWVKKDSLRGFKQLFKTDLAHNIGIDPSNEAAVNTGIDSLINTHVNQTFRLRYNSTNRNAVLPEKTIWNYDLLLEESGSLAWLIDKYIDKKHYNGINDNEPQIFGTTYSQYIKLDAGTSFAKNFSPHSQLAGKGRIGWMTPYGKAEATPEERRFYAGGANSMRGWLFNTLGPGNSSSEVAATFGADIKLEFSLEYRLKFFRLFNQSSGVTFFTDIGNIWDRTGPYAFSLGSLTRDFALDSGVGLRIGSPIGPFRFDFAYKLHDPAEVRRWRFSTLDLSKCTFNFGIGEAF
ncbi:MAG: outer membrane protein assembly factor [Chlorobium sp.]|nr:MAG: outer membrane protein assembly factor [Chlorobium sp.]